MSDLADFLLARIAEDEAVADSWPPDAHPGVAPNGQQWVDGHGHPIYWPRARVLAECEAKRLIVEHVRRYTGTSITCDDRSGAVSGRVLLLLGLPYADHPDFQPEWRL